MESTPNLVLIILYVIGVFLTVLGPPIWWYRRGRLPGERREKNWAAIFIGIVLIGSLGSPKPSAKGDWMPAVLAIGRVLIGAWSIAIGAKGKRVAP